jgi:phage protein D
MGYMNEMVLMLTGVITALEPNFPEASYSTLSVRGLNVLHTLRTEQHTYSWPDDGSSEIRDSDIAVKLGNMPLQAGKAGLGIKVKTDPALEETAETSVMMYNQYDIAFLLERARRHGYQVVLNEQSDSNPERYLFFGPGESKRAAPAYRLVWGKTLTSFKPKLDTGRLLASLTWRGWDRQNDQLIEEKASWDDPDGVPAGPERERLKLILQAFGVRNEVRVSPAPRTKAEARQSAKQILTRQYQEMVTATGVTVGLPDLRAGSKVQIEGLGTRYSGRYYVTSTTHTIGDGGYRTQFDARRDPADQQ